MENFKSYRASVGTTLDTVYTVPASTTAIILGCQVANRGAGNGWASLAWTRGVDTTYLAYEIGVPEGAAWGLVTGKAVLQAGDVLKAQAQGDVDLTLSLVEVSP
jgi:hypothetical protein